NGLVFIGNAGGDIKGVKGRMYALDAKTGKIVWEFYLVPKAEGDPTRGLALQAAGHPNRERGRAVCGRQACPLLSGLGWRRRVERSRLRSPVEPAFHRRGRMVHHRYAYAG